MIDEEFVPDVPSGFFDGRIPPDAVVNGEIHIVSYMDFDSNMMKYNIVINGSMNVAQSLGLIELSKVSILNSYYSGVEDADDDDEDEDDEEEDDEHEQWRN